MKRLSEQTAALLGQLYACRHSLGFIWHRRANAERIQLIEQIAQQRELAAITPLLEFLFDPSKTVAASASDAIHLLLETAASEDLLALDVHLRSTVYWPRPSVWLHLQPSRVRRLPKTERSRTAILGLASCHRSGYVRQRAILELSRSHDGSEIPFLLIRLNDWVANVRKAARACLDQRLQQGPLAPFVRHLPLVLRLTECGRDDHTGVVEIVLRRLLEPEHAKELTEIILHGERSVARRCFQLAMQLLGPHQNNLLQMALQGKDAVLRLWATRLVPTVETGHRLAEFLTALENDRFMPVRREALRLRMQQLPETACAALHHALLDDSPALREFARFYLRKLNPMDFADLYRTALTDTHRRRAAIAGLGETGTQEDARLLVPFLSSSDRQERRAAVRAVGRLAADEYRDLLMECLTDDSPKIVRSAQQVLEEHRELLAPERLWIIFATDHRLFVRRAALALLDCLDTWTRVPYLIRAAADQDVILAQQARNYIERRFNKVFTKPTAAQKRRIRAGLVECADCLDAEFLKRLKYHIGL